MAVHDRLRAAILRGELEPGSSVSQASLAGTFGAGRTPLREALRLLQREGLVVSAPNQRVRIAPLSAGDFEELAVARLALETVALQITVPGLTSAEFAALEGYLAQMDHYHRAGDLAGRWGPHRAFHQALVTGAGSRVGAQLGTLADHAERYRLRFNAAGQWDERRAEHRAILDAAVAGDAHGAALHLARHQVRTVRLVFGLLDPGHDLGRLRLTLRATVPGAERVLDEG